MPPDAPSPSSPDLKLRGQRLVAELAALHDTLGQQLADLQQKLSAANSANQQANAANQQLQQKLGEAQARGQELQQTLSGMQTRNQDLQHKVEANTRAEQQWAADRKSMLAKHEGESKTLRDQVAALQGDNDALQAYQLQWASEREEHLKARREAATQHAELKGQLQSMSEENANLKELHTRVTQQATSLVSEWSSRRQAQAADAQRLRGELEQTQKALGLSRQREKEWQTQVTRLQNELRGLKTTAGQMTLSDEQSHHLLSQLNAIIGFAEVLLDEAGSRATGEERVEFLHDIKDSGAHLAEYVQGLTKIDAEAFATAEPAGSQPAPRAPANWAARTILVAATDEAVRERTQALLDKAGYRIEFAGDADDALTLAARLQPLVIMIDTDLPPDGGQRLVDMLKLEPRTRDVPVVLAASTGQEPLGLTIDRYDLVSKPINKQQLLQLMVKYDLLADRRRTAKMPASVLVIDDDPRNTRLIKAMLKPLTVNVLMADGGAAGIKLATRSRPDLIILDLMMPDVDGFQVVSTLRNDPATSQIPILIYTAKNITAADRRRLESNIEAIVRKGELSKEQFLDLVYKRGERRNSPADAEAAA